MQSFAMHMQGAGHGTVLLDVVPQTTERNRLTTFFRILLALPHLVLVGGPMAAVATWTWNAPPDHRYELGATGGLLGSVIAVITVIAWFTILFTGQHPRGLWELSAFYLRWRVRAAAYVALLRDEYPPFGDADYPASFYVEEPKEARDRLTVAFRIFLALPHLLALWAIGVAWAITSLAAWVVILFTGRYPEGLYRFAVGALRWSVRVEAYLLLLRDEYPPFSLFEPA